MIVFSDGGRCDNYDSHWVGTMQHLMKISRYTKLFFSGKHNIHGKQKLFAMNTTTLKENQNFS